MRAPRKIYFGFDENTHLESYCLKKKGNATIEFINKDMLLEWAEGSKKIVDSKMRANPCQDLATKSVMWSVFISQINSM